MKPKELSQRTGLKERTIRFYVEQGLLSPSVERRNGRNYREYTEQDVEALNTIASLRRAWFTLEEIRRMQADPSSIREILPQYRQWLIAQQEQLQGLLAAAERIDPAAVRDYQELSRLIAAESRQLPLPAVDVRPHFRYLDAIEERPPHVQMQTNFSESGDSSRAARFAVASRAHQPIVLVEDYLQGIGIRDYPAELENGTVTQFVQRDSRPLQWLKQLYTVISALLGAWCLISLIYWGVDVYLLLPALLFVLAFGFRMLLTLYSWRRDRQGWLTDTLDQPDPEGGHIMRHRIPWGYLGTALLVLAIAVPAGWRLWQVHRINSSYHQRADVVFQPTRITQSRQKLAQWDIDTAMPGNGNQVLTFTAPGGMTFRDTGYSNINFHRGDTLESDFVSWSHDYFRERFMRLRVNGMTIDARLSNNQAARLYMAALRQNGLEAQFQADFGRRLNLFTAQRAMRLLDQRLFEAGIFRAYDYPYDRRLEQTFLAIVILFAIPISVILMAALSTLADHIRYRIWLRSYNREHMADWERVAGTLPQFVSLKESGLATPVPQLKKKRLRQRLMGLYRV